MACRCEKSDGAQRGEGFGREKHFDELYTEGCVYSMQRGERKVSERIQVCTGSIGSLAKNGMGEDGRIEKLSCCHCSCFVNKKMCIANNDDSLLLSDNHVNGRFERYLCCRTMCDLKNKRTEGNIVLLSLDLLTKCALRLDQFYSSTRLCRKVLVAQFESKSPVLVVGIT